MEKVIPKIGGTTAVANAASGPPGRRTCGCRRSLGAGRFRVPGGSRAALRRDDDQATDKPDEFQTETRYVQASTGRGHAAHGKVAHLYRIPMARAVRRGADSDGMREVMLLDRNQRALTGRWFTGGYDDIGIDVTLRGLGNDPVVLGSTELLCIRLTTREVQIHGANFPGQRGTAAAIDFGRGVTVKRVVSSSPEVLARVEVEVAKDAPVGPRDVSVAGAFREGSGDGL